MADNKITISGQGAFVSGIASLLNAFRKYFKTPEEKAQTEAETRKTRSETQNIQAATITESLKSFAEAQKLEIEVLQMAVELLKSVGHTDEQIQGFVRSKMISIYDPVKVLRDLKAKGVILNVTIKELNEPSSKITRINR